MAIALDTNPDLGSIRRLFREYADSLGFSLDFQDFERELADLPGAYGPPQGALVLVTIDGDPAGCAGLRRLAPTTAELKRLYVRPEGRGRGLGRMLTEGLITVARERGYQRIRLDTTPEMDAAQRLYRALGFHEIAPYTHNPIAGTRFLELDLSGG